MGQISEKTVVTWMEEFNRLVDDNEIGEAAFEAMLRRNADFVSNEPIFLGFLSIIMDKLNLENPISAAIFALSLFRELRKKQDLSDKLTQESS